MLLTLTLLTLAPPPQAVAPRTEVFGPPRLAFTRHRIALPGSPTGVVAAPLDAGPVPDVALVVVGSTRSRFWVMEGLGDGAFQTAFVSGLGSQHGSAHTLRVLDFDADGWNDVSIPSYLSSGGLRFGDGTLLYDEKVAVPSVGGDLLDHRFADYTGDGLLDSMKYVTDIGGFFVDTAENDGSGGFVNLTSGDAPASYTIHAHLATADFDGDGLASDFAVTSLFGLGIRAYAAGSSTPLFTQTGEYGESQAADVDGDGDADLIVTRVDRGGLESHANDGTGGLTLIDGIALGERPEHVQLADLDVDGDLDAVTTTSGADALRVAWNDGLGGLQASVPFAAGDFPTDLTLSDLDLDGDVDAVVANPLDDSLSVLLSSPAP